MFIEHLEFRVVVLSGVNFLYVGMFWTTLLWNAFKVLTFLLYLWDISYENLLYAEQKMSKITSRQHLVVSKLQLKVIESL